jgi:hypothetical protein
LLKTQAFFKAVAVTVEFQDMAVVGQAVEERSRQPLVTEDLQPAAKLQVRGDKETSLQVPLGKSLEEQPGTFWRKRYEAHLVHDEQVQPDKLGQALAQCTLVLGFQELVGQPGGSEETDLLPQLAGQYPEGAGEGGVRQWQGDLMRGRDCHMEMDGDIKRLTCPGGQIMEASVAREDRGSYFYRFHPDAGKCEGCTLRARCYRNKSTYRDFRIKKEYFETLSLRARMTEKLSSEHGKKRMRGRSCLIEHVFGEVKEIFRFRRFLHRSLEKVRLIWQLVCIGYNLRKMARLAYG